MKCPFCDFETLSSIAFSGHLLSHNKTALALRLSSLMFEIEEKTDQELEI